MIVDVDNQDVNLRGYFTLFLLMAEVYNLLDTNSKGYLNFQHICNWVILMVQVHDLDVNLWLLVYVVFHNNRCKNIILDPTGPYPHKKKKSNWTFN